MNRKGFTLVEIIVVLTIFSVVAIITLNAYLTSMKAEQRSSIENSIMQDSKYVLARIAQEISTNTIDYEEYFNQCVLGQGCPNKEFVEAEKSNYSSYGTNHGYYNWQFYFGGYQDNSAIINFDGYGAVCQKSDLSFVDFPNSDCVTNRLSFSEDFNTGQNPSAQSFEVSNPAIASTASAICGSSDGAQKFTNNLEDIEKVAAGSLCNPSGDVVLSDLSMKELYLISADGNNKTIIGREKISNDPAAAYTVSIGKLTKSTQLLANLSPTSSDIPVPVYGFTCLNGFICNELTELEKFGLADPVLDQINTFNRNDFYTYTDGENIFSDFIPISPLRVNIKNLEFIISPIEDPFKGFSEDPASKIQPKVTIILEIEPSQRFKLPFFSPNFNLKLQTTVTTGVTTEVPLNTPIE